METELQCPMCCEETFPDVESLQRHIRELITRIKCPICNEPFENLTDLAAHLSENCFDSANNDSKNMISSKEHEADNMEFYCEICDLYLNDMEKHLEMYHEGEEITLENQDCKSNEVDNDITDKDVAENIIKIEYDEKEYRTIIVLNESTESNTEEYRCEKCNFSTKIIEKLSTHKCKFNDTLGPPSKKNSKVPSKKINFACDICLTKFTHMRALFTHQKMHVKPTENTELFLDEAPPQPVQKFQCHVCHKVYGKEFEEAHMKSHYDKTVTCSVCNRHFYDATELEMHARLHNTKKVPFCTLCKKTFETAALLSAHYEEHSDRKYDCSFCKKSFLKMHEKVKHERIHTGIKPYVCQVCGKKFRVQYCLTLHLRTHTGQRPYTCETCGKRFKSHSVYNHHVQTHSDVRPYQCPFCPKAFKTAVQLAGHKNCHTKPFSCTVCNRPFSSLYAVRNHMEIHKRANNLTYECNICGAVYARAFGLRDHLASAHSENEDAAKELQGLIGTENKEDKTSDATEQLDCYEVDEN